MFYHFEARVFPFSLYLKPFDGSKLTTGKFNIFSISPSVVTLVSSLPLSAFSLMLSPVEAYHSQFLEEARLFLPSELHLLSTLYLGSLPLLVYLIAPIHWIRLHEIFSSTLHKEKSSDQALLPVLLSTLTDFP